MNSFDPGQYFTVILIVCDTYTEFEGTLWWNNLSKLLIWLRHLAQKSVSCPKTTMGTLLIGGWGWLERLWECSDSWGTFLVWNEPSHFIEKHTTTNKEHPWPDNKAIWSRSFKSSLYTPSCPQPTPFLCMPPFVIVAKIIKEFFP